MSSPREPRAPLNLPLGTYGETPAAIYLAHYLNEKGDHSLARKCGKKLSKWRTVMNDVVASHTETDQMLATTFATLLLLIDAGMRESAQGLPDKLCRELVTNLLVGEIKTWKTRSARTGRLHRVTQSTTPQGQHVPDTKTMLRAGDETFEERTARLRKRSAEYLARRGKINTLY